MTVAERPLREEIASAVIQGSAAAASIAGLVLLILRAWPQPSTVPLVAVLVYGASLIVAFLASALYHGVWHRRLKAVFRAIDHCTIFLLIAGTYTPVALIALWHHSGWLLLATIWTLAIVGAVLRLVRGARFHRVAIPLYLTMGWLGIAWVGTLYHVIGLAPLLLFAAGGLAYTGGLLFYRWTGLPFSNPLWHVCVVAGSACFYIAIIFYVVPSAA
jgi:hemolysin III